MKALAVKQSAPAEPYPKTLYNEEAEQALLGGMIVEPRVVEAIADRVSADDFYHPVHGRIFAAIVEMVDEGKAPNPVSLKHQFGDDPELKAVGGGMYFVNLIEVVGTGIVAAAEMAEGIRDLARKRRFVDALDELKQRASAQSEKYETLAAALDVPLAAALEDDRAATNVWSVSQLYDRTVRRLEDEAAGKIPAGVKTSFLPDFNDIIGGGMRRGDVTILAGRPAMGKTAVALSIANGAAALGHGVLFISLEVDADMLGTRVVADTVFEWGVSPKYDIIKSGKFNEFDRQKIDATAKRIANWPLTIIDPATMKAGSLAMTVRRHQRMMKARGVSLDLVVIDYLQLVKSDRKREKIYEEVTDVSRVLKPLAKETGTAVLALAQVSRKVEEREDKRPHLSDLRDSGHIEQDADNVVFLYRHEYYLKQQGEPKKETDKAGYNEALDQARDMIEIYSDKVRHGATLKRTCFFFAEHQAVRGSRYFEELRR